MVWLANCPQCGSARVAPVSIGLPGLQLRREFEAERRFPGPCFFVVCTHGCFECGAHITRNSQGTTWEEDPWTPHFRRLGIDW